MKSLAPIGLLVMAMALAACQGETSASQGGDAAGEVLPGAASDAMLPYDTVRSQPPLAPPPAAKGTPAAKASGDAEEEPAAESSEAAQETATTAPPSASSAAL